MGMSRAIPVAGQLEDAPVIYHAVGCAQTDQVMDVDFRRDLNERIAQALGLHVQQTWCIPATGTQSLQAVTNCDEGSISVYACAATRTVHMELSLCADVKPASAIALVEEAFKPQYVISRP